MLSFILYRGKSKLGDILGVEGCVQIVNCRVSYTIFWWDGKNDACGTTPLGGYGGIFPRKFACSEVNTSGGFWGPKFRVC